MVGGHGARRMKTVEMLESNVRSYSRRWSAKLWPQQSGDQSGNQRVSGVGWGRPRLGHGHSSKDRIHGDLQLCHPS